MIPLYGEPPARSLCTDCGISRTDDPKRCGRACQFIAPDYPALETAAHGRARDTERRDELHFGTHIRLLRAKLVPPKSGAQWTGIATRTAERLLETGAVTGVLTMKPHPEDRWRPVPTLVTDPVEMAACRGMRMGYAPLLALLEPAIAAGHRRLAVIGIPCQVYALRALEAELGKEQVREAGHPLQVAAVLLCDGRAAVLEGAVAGGVREVWAEDVARVVRLAEVARVASVPIEALEAGAVLGVLAGAGL